MHRIRSFAATAVSIAMLGVFAVPGAARAAGVTVTVTDGTSAVAGAFVAAVDTASGAAVDAVVSGTDGRAVLDTGSTALASLRLYVSKQGYDTTTAGTVAAETTVTVKASASSSLRFANVFGAQSKAIVADAESGVFYALTDGSPSVWRTTDHAGNWAAVPTTADAANGLPQVQAQKVATSGFRGEVAVQLQRGLWYSRDYGTTWSSLDTNVGFNNIWWAHSGGSSYLFAQTGNAMKIAVMSAATPVLQDWTMPAGVAASDAFAVAAGSQASGQVFVAGAPRDGSTPVKVWKLTKNASTPAGVTATLQATANGLTFLGTSTNDLLMISTLGGAEIAAVVAYDKEGQGTNVGGSTGTLRAAYSADGSTFSPYTAGLKGPGTGFGGGSNFDNLNNWSSFSTIGSTDMSGCGENETPPVGSLAPVSPGGSTAYGAFQVVGTIRSCLFALNTSGSSANWAGQSGASVEAGKIAVLPMNGANNNTGFVFDGEFDFSTNWVAVSGDGQYGFRKSAAAFASPAFRPQFGQAGSGVANDFILNQAKPGKGTDSGGVAVNGIVAPAVQDIAMSPNSTDGSTYLVSTNPSGGSRTLLTTDGGRSFSTVNASGSTALDWWNGADGKQWIVGGSPLDQKRYFRAKHFTTATGTGPTQMGEELAATAAQRDSATDAGLRFTTNSSDVRPMSVPCFGLDHFISTGSDGCAGGPTDNSQGVIAMTALAGVVGTDKVLVAVSRGTVGQQGQAQYGTVGLVTLSANPGDDGATVSDVRYFGTAVADAGTAANASTQFGAGAVGTYGGIVTNVAYCPTGSAARLADKAFVAVHGRGVYVISSVSSSPVHGAAPVTTASFKDLKADCDTGLLVGASSTGPMLSFDGANFVQVRAGNVGDSSSVDVQANKTNGDVSVLVASGGNVVQIETSFPELGVVADAVAAGTAKTPSAPPSLAASAAKFLNDAGKGRDVGQVADVEFAPEAGDKVTKSGVHAAGVAGVASADRRSLVASSSGAYSASLAKQTLTSLLAGAKISTVKKGKTILLATAVKKSGGKIPAKSRIVVSMTAASKKVCRVTGTRIKGLKKGNCTITVKVTPPRTKKVPRPKTTTTKVRIAVT